MAKYGFRSIAPGHRELVEMADYPGDPTVKPTHWTNAHYWVQRGGQHNTGLWHDGERIRYAESDPSA